MRTFIKPEWVKLETEQAIAATCGAFMHVLEKPPSGETLAILSAHTALETGQWGQNVSHGLCCYNVGNVKGYAPRTGLFTMYECNERLPEAVAEHQIANAPIRTDNGGPSAVLESKNRDGTWTVRFYPPHPQTVFRAYRTAEDGLEEYIRFLFTDTTPDNGRPNKWQKAADAAVAGDLKAFVFSLYDPDGNPKTHDGYFTARPELYYDGGDGPGGKPGMLAIYDKLLARCRLYVASIAPPQPDERKTTLEQARRELGLAYTSLNNAILLLDKLSQ